MSNVQEIVAFLKAKGLSKVAVAGILGNLEVESGFNPMAYNADEHAVGIAQWEGSRLDSLKAFAAHHKYLGGVNSLNTQLHFLWHELTGDPQQGVLRALGNATTAAQAATIWDSQYERSSGDARQWRIDNADKWYKKPVYERTAPAQNVSAGTGSSVPPAHGVGGGGTSGGGGGGGGGNVTITTGTDGGVAPKKASAADVKATLGNDPNLGNLGQLFESIPELSKIIDKAQKNGWSTDRFENAVEDSKWWKAHSATARSVIAERLNDPASWTQSLQNTEKTISTLSGQLGMHLTWDQVQAITKNALLTGNDSNQQWLTSEISNHENYKGLKTVDGMKGQMASTIGQLQQMSAAYGYDNWDAAGLAKRAQQVVSGATTIDSYQNVLKGWAKSAFPGLAKELDAGQTVADLAAPYQQSMSNLLEVDPGTLNTFTPAIRKALQGYTDPSTKERTTTPLWQFEQQTRADPRWQYTQNAKDTMSSALVKIGQDFGFGL